MKLLSVIRKRNIDICIYAALIFLYGIGWDYVLDKKIEPWSLIGVLSYTAFVLILFAKNQHRAVADLTGTMRPKTRLDYVGKLVVALILFGLLMFKLLSLE